MMALVFAKSNFRNGGANLPVCLDSRQGIATISEITFGNQSNRARVRLDTADFPTRTVNRQMFDVLAVSVILHIGWW